MKPPAASANFQSACASAFACAAPPRALRRTAALTALTVSIVALAFMVAGCVTINIYFPAAAAEKAADRIIEEVYQLRKDATPAKPAEAK